MQMRGSLLLIAVSLCVVFSYASRDGFKEPAPAFLSGTEPGTTLVELGQGFCPQGIHQFIDGYPGYAVNNLTTCLASDQRLLQGLESTPLQNGEKLEIIEKAPHRPYLQRSWMTAAGRQVLGIDLQPDQMIYEDWLDIPGIGPVMAKRIELDRQKYGEFGSLDNLRRVPGIGDQRIKHIFFQNDGN
jgi:competence protein ComEA